MKVVRNAQCVGIPISFVDSLLLITCYSNQSKPDCTSNSSDFSLFFHETTNETHESQRPVLLRVENHSACETHYCNSEVCYS